MKKEVIKKINIREERNWKIQISIILPRFLLEAAIQFKLQTRQIKIIGSSIIILINN